VPCTGHGEGEGEGRQEGYGEDRAKNKDNKIIANMLKFGKQSSLKQKWEVSLKSSSLFVRNHVSKIVLIQQKQNNKQQTTKTTKQTTKIYSSASLCRSPVEPGSLRVRTHCLGDNTGAVWSRGNITF
jgi:hypothetical protein